MSDEAEPDWLNHTHSKRAWRCIQFLYLYEFIDKRDYLTALARWRTQFKTDGYHPNRPAPPHPLESPDDV